jgi:hypothetical protein
MGVDMELVEAVKTGNVEAVGKLLDSGVDLNQQDKHGWKPLNWAAARGKLEIVQLLLQRGADVYATGIDQRTPAMIALAAGHADVASVLRQAEAQSTGEKPDQPERHYCKAFHLQQLRSFAGWQEKKLEAARPADQAAGAGQVQPVELTDNAIVYVHEDFAVTADIWRNEKVIFDQVTPEWKEFCFSTLGFKVPDDLDLIASSATKSTAATVQ